MIQQQMKEERFACITEKDKGFIIAFTQAMEELGYTYDDTIGNGFCWGKYMLIFRKANVKSKNVVARIYIREDAIVLRMFFNNVTKHASFISAAPAYIKTVFTRKRNIEIIISEIPGGQTGKFGPELFRRTFAHVYTFYRKSRHRGFKPRSIRAKARHAADYDYKSSRYSGYDDLHFLG